MTEEVLARIREVKEKDLKVLNLSLCELTEIPKEALKLLQLNNLTTVNLSNNNITDISIIQLLTNLTELNLSNNNITDISSLQPLTNLTILDLTDNKITDISFLQPLTKLVKLNLSENEVTDLSHLQSLTNLTSLNLFSNKIKDIRSLQHCIDLTELILSKNRIEDLTSLKVLTKLNKLYLFRNKITDISFLEPLTNLTELVLSNNQIIDYSHLQYLTKLHTLYLTGNQVTDISFLQTLTNLTTLYLSNNQITDIKPLLSLIKKGISVKWKEMYGEKGIILENNPLTTPPPEIILQGNEAILEYFDQREKSGAELLNEAKLILLGDGRSGKTSLANRLLGKELPKEADRTQGVDIIIGEYGFPLANGRNFKINIWDFAGQDKYKTLHQLFYTESSLYVMVAESGNMTVDYDDWFQTAALFGEGSPLVVVLNEFKEGIGMGSFDSSYWIKQFPELVKEVFTVNLGTKQNVADVETYIHLLAQTLPHTKYTFPSNWAAIRRILNERRGEQYIMLKEYLEICKSNDLLERESALILSSVLHKIGDCLHYQKSELLKQFIILKNEWATEAVYKILDDKVVAEEKGGFFDKSDLKRIWNSPQYEDMRPQLLELMKQFKLAYQLPGKEEYVTPPLLPPASPAGYAWPDLDALELYIEYEFLPKALLTQFIVTRHADIAKNRTLVWRYGVVLTWEGEALAEVSKTKLQGRDAYYIRTQGANRKGMMTVIIKTFRELHADYKGIKYKEKVPCTCEGCRTGKNKQHYFDFDNLKFRLEKRRHEVECNNSL